MAQGSEDWWLIKLFRLAGISQQKISKIDSAVAPISALCTLAPVSWGFSIGALYLGKNTPAEWPFFEKVFWAFFLVGCSPLAIALIVAVYFAATNPDHLRSAKFALEAEKLRQQRQGTAAGVTIDVTATEVGGNPTPKLDSPPTQSTALQEAKDAG